MEITEYQKIAALLAQDIEIAFKASERAPELSDGLLKDLMDRRTKTISDKEYRDKRYSAAQSIYAALPPITMNKEK